MPPDPLYLEAVPRFNSAVYVTEDEAIKARNSVSAISESKVSLNDMLDVLGVSHVHYSDKEYVIPFLIEVQDVGVGFMLSCQIYTE